MLVIIPESVGTPQFFNTPALQEGHATVTESGFFAGSSPDVSSDNSCFSPVFESESAGRQYLKIPTQTKWDHSQEREFAKLARLIALEEHTNEEMSRFLKLQEQRRKQSTNPSATDIIRQSQLRQMEKKLLDDLNTYVRFLGSSRC